MLVLPEPYSISRCWRSVFEKQFIRMLTFRNNKDVWLIG